MNFIRLCTNLGKSNVVQYIKDCKRIMCFETTIPFSGIYPRKIFQKKENELCVKMYCKFKATQMLQ